MKHIRFFTLMASVLFGLIIIACGSNASNGGNQSSNNDSNGVSEKTSSSELEGITWFYNKRVDDLTNEVTSLNASIVSTNRIRIDNYGNTARMAMTLGYSTDFSRSPSTSVMFSFVDDNQLCRLSSTHSSGILAVFDNGDVDDRWGFINMNKKRDALYMFNPNLVAPFVMKLKESKHARIQVNLEVVGPKTFDFDIDGLKWDFSE